MLKCVVVAYRAPVGGGIATYEDGVLDGDDEILDRALDLDGVDWNDNVQAAEALRAAALEVYGEPVEVLVPRSQLSRPPMSAA